MTNTTNYNLNLVEGTDIVNPLVQFNPNFTTIDGAMKANADAAIDRATCVKSGTQHSVTRTNTAASVFRFTATGDWTTGDTMLVDTVPVTVYTPNGTAPLTGAFVINTEVLASINGTRVVIYTANTQASSIDAIDVVYDNSISGLTAITAQGAIDELRASDNILYDNTVSGLAATDVKDAIDELAGSISTAHYRQVSQASASQTYSAQITALTTAFTALSDDEKLRSIIKIGTAIFRCEFTTGLFMHTYIRTAVNMQCVNMEDATYKVTGSNLSIVNKSTDTNAEMMTLYVLD